MSWKIEGNVELVKCSHRFNVFARENAGVLAKYLGEEIFPGSLNIKTNRPGIGRDLDSGKVAVPDIVIPKDELREMPNWLGDARAWHCYLWAVGVGPVRCFLFRRFGSRVRPGIVEVLARESFVKVHGFGQGEKVVLEGF